MNSQCLGVLGGKHEKTTSEKKKNTTWDSNPTTDPKNVFILTYPMKHNEFLQFLVRDTLRDTKVLQGAVQFLPVEWLLLSTRDGLV